MPATKMTSEQKLHDKYAHLLIAEAQFLEAAGWVACGLPSSDARRRHALAPSEDQPAVPAEHRNRDPEKRDGMTDQANRLAFAFCESVTASNRSPWHIRPLEKDQALKKSGGIDTDSLCDTVKAPYGWDLRPMADDWLKEEFVCKACRARYEDYLACGQLYFELDGKKYARIRGVDGLEKQLIEKLARVEWYSLTNPTTDRPFFLMELVVRRRMHVDSKHWFKPEEFKFCVPQEKVSAEFRRALLSLKSGVSSSTGTSSARSAKKSVQRTTSGSRR
jgi:hypothetical protein